MTLSAAMARYYLNLYNHGGPVLDEEGHEVRDLEAARAQAIAGIRSILAEELLHGRLDLGGRMEIVDESGRILATIPFREAVIVHPEEEP